MFALLEHDTRQRAGRGRPARAGQVHWDLLIELPGQERLASWRLARNPLEYWGPIPAQRIAAHRRFYLEFEGQISGGRGRVKRLDRGEAVLLESGAELVVAELAGSRLRGRYELPRGGSGRCRRRDGRRRC